MKKSSLIFTLLFICAAIAGIVYLLQQYSEKIPFLSRFTNDEIEPEEDLFGDISDVLISEDIIEALPEEKRQARIRRGYIPLRFHEQTDM